MKDKIHLITLYENIAQDLNFIKNLFSKVSEKYKDAQVVFESKCDESLVDIYIIPELTTNERELNELRALLNKTKNQ